MAKWIIEDTTLTDIADSIREQLGTTDTIPVYELSSKILEIGGTTPSSGGSVEIGEYVPVNNTSNFEIETELTSVNGVVFVRTSEGGLSNGELSSLSATNILEAGANSYGSSVRSNWGNVGTSTATKGICPIEFDDGILSFDGSTNCWSAVNTFVKGKTYKYFIF